MPKPLVSWLLTAYNAEKSIRRALDSMVAQTYTDFDAVIIVEAGCCDNTYDICLAYANADKRFRVYLNEKRIGVGASLAKGLSLCNGEYIARLDADDYSYPQRLQKQLEFMGQNPDIGALFSHRRVIEGGVKRVIPQSTDSDIIGASLLFGVADLCHSTAFLRREVFLKNDLNYSAVKQAEDYLLWTSLIAMTKFACLPEVLVDYYADGANLTLHFKEEIGVMTQKISRKTIEARLALDTTPYPDYLFGVKDYTELPHGTDKYEFIKKSLSFIEEILLSNKTLNKFNEKALIEVLTVQFKKYILLSGLIYVYSLDDYLLNRVSVTKALSLIKETDKRLQCTDTKVLVYGAGKSFRDFMFAAGGELPFHIVAIVDSSPKRYPLGVLGFNILSADAIKTASYDYILITSALYADEIKQNLLNQYFIDPSKLVMAGKAYISLLAESSYKRYIKKTVVYPKRAFLFLAPDYGNLGDQAIAIAEHKFMRKFFGYELIEVPSGKYDRFAKRIIKKFIKNNDLIIITGGGFLGSLYPQMENRVRDVLNEFSENPVIIFPQTLYWDNASLMSDELKKSQEIYDKHNNLIICARDPISFELFKKTYKKCKVNLIPDIVLSVDWHEFIDRKLGRDSILLCLKRDKESKLSENDKLYLKDIANTFSENVKYIDNMIDGDVWINDREYLLKDVLRLYGASEIVITDRLHGLIFSIITGTPCVVLNNCNHKLRESFKLLKHIPNIKFADSLESVEGKCKEAISAGYMEYKPLNDYKELMEIIQEVLP